MNASGGSQAQGSAHVITALTLLGLIGADPAFAQNRWPSIAQTSSEAAEAAEDAKNRRKGAGKKAPRSPRDAGPGDHDTAEGSLHKDGLTGVSGPHGETLTIDSKGLTLKYPENFAKLRIGGRLHLDAGSVGVAPVQFGRALEDNFIVRRSRIESYLTLHDAFELIFQYDFADKMRPIKDAVVSYRGLDPFIFTIGNFKEPFSLNRLISDNDTLLVERSLADALAPGRDFGATVGASGEKWTLVAGVFGGNASQGISDSGIAGTVRATYAPILSQHEVLHFGIAGSYRSLNRNSTPPSFATRPEAFLFSESKQLVDTDAIRNVSTTERLGFEAAYQNGPFRVQAEYILTQVSRFGMQPNLSLQGGYIEAGWVLNGQDRPYRVKPEYGSEYAVFDGVEVADAQRVTRGGYGVFELGARFSALDLADRDVLGGIERNVTVGLNWYPDKNVRLMANYVCAYARPSAQLNGRTVRADIFVSRLQLYW